MPNLKGIDFSLWEDIGIEPWQEYNREMLLIQDSNDKSDTKGTDDKILEYLQEESPVFHLKDIVIFDFARKYTTITWVLAYLGYHSAITAIVSIVNSWSLISLLKDNFTVEDILIAKTPEIADKIYNYIVIHILSPDKIVLGLPYSEKEPFDVKLLHISSMRGHAFGIRKTTKNLPPTPQNKWKIAIAAERLSMGGNLEAFKEIFPFLTDATITLIIQRASSNITKYIYEQKPYLRKSKK